MVRKSCLPMVRKYWLTFEDLEIPDRNFGSPPDYGYFRFDKCIGVMSIPEQIVEGEIASWCGREMPGEWMASSWVEMGCQTGRYPTLDHNTRRHLRSLTAALWRLTATAWKLMTTRRK